MSGYEFLGKLRSQWPSLPVLMITAYATPKLAVEAIKAGAIDYLAKPFCAGRVVACRGPLRGTPPVCSRKMPPPRDHRRNVPSGANRRRSAENARAAPVDSDVAPTDARVSF